MKDIECAGCGLLILLKCIICVSLYDIIIRYYASNHSSIAGVPAKLICDAFCECSLEQWFQNILIMYNVLGNSPQYSFINALAAV